MGQKNDKDPQRRLKRSDTLKTGLRKKSANLFDDAVDLEEESEILKIGDKKTQNAQNVKKISPLLILTKLNYGFNIRKHVEIIKII